MSNVYKIELPETPKIIREKENEASFEISPCYPGYGVTLGNALRRALLSSLAGAAVTSLKINRVNHEFSGIPGVKEDVIQIMLAFKRLRIKVHPEASDSIMLSLSAKGKKKVLAKDIKVPDSIEIINKDLHLATLTEKTSTLEIEINLKRGIGYLAVDDKKREEKRIGFIMLDAIFTPIRRVNYRVQNIRVGDRTDFNKLIIDIETDGTITPKEAFTEASNVLVQHFQSFIKPLQKKRSSEPVVDFSKVTKETMVKTKPSLGDGIIEDLRLSSRTMTALRENRIKKISSLIKKSEEQLMNMHGLGEKSVKEIKREIGKLGLFLEQKEDETS